MPEKFAKRQAKKTDIEVLDVSAARVTLLVMARISILSASPVR